MRVGYTLSFLLLPFTVWIKEETGSRWQSKRMYTHFLLQECQNHNSLSSHWQEDAGTHQRERYPCPRSKEKLQWDGGRGAIIIKSNPIPASWTNHKLENNNTKEVLPLLWRFWPLHQAFQPGNPAKGLGIPRESDFEGQQNLTTGLPQDWGKHTSLLEGTDKILSSPRPRGNVQWPHRRLN